MSSLGLGGRAIVTFILVPNSIVQEGPGIKAQLIYMLVNLSCMWCMKLLYNSIYRNDCTAVCKNLKLKYTILEIQ